MGLFEKKILIIILIMEVELWKFRRLSSFYRYYSEKREKFQVKTGFFENYLCGKRGGKAVEKGGAPPWKSGQLSRGKHAGKTGGRKKREKGGKKRESVSPFGELWNFSARVLHKGLIKNAGCDIISST